jgi:hypothetical protein
MHFHTITGTAATITVHRNPQVKSTLELTGKVCHVTNHDKTSSLTSWHGK